MLVQAPQQQQAAEVVQAVGAAHGGAHAREHVRVQVGDQRALNNSIRHFHRLARAATVGLADGDGRGVEPVS